MAPGLRPHAEAIERGEPETAVDAPAIFQGAQAGAAAQMRHDDPALGDLWCDLRQDRGDVLVGQPVKAVALHAGAADLPGQRNQFRDGRLTAMEARVEAGDLRHAGKPLGHRVNRRQVVRLMERGERDQLPQILQNRRRDNGRTGEPCAAMHDAVTDTKNPRAAVLGAEPRGERIERRARVADGAVQRVIGEDAGPGASFAENRGEVPMPSIWPRASRRQASTSGLPIDAELEARGARVEHDCVVVHDPMTPS